jgi:hypothetical protein
MAKCPRWAAIEIIDPGDKDRHARSRDHTHDEWLVTKTTDPDFLCGGGVLILRRP